MTKKITKSFRLEPKTVEELERLVEYYQKIDTLGRKVTATDVIEFLIKGNKEYLL